MRMSQPRWTMRRTSPLLLVALAACSAPRPPHTPMKTPPTTVTSEPAPRRALLLDFLFLDRSSCGRCSGTEAAIEEAVAATRDALALLGAEVHVRALHVTDLALAEREQFSSSPTLRVDGVDLAPVLQENSCEDCGDLAGCADGILCRTWSWRGATHDVPPAALIAEGLLSAALSPHAEAPRGEYQVPDNLRRFFDGAASPRCSSPGCRPETP